jgi:hypothetical protein
LNGSFVTINNSPIELGHVLIIPRLNHGLEQVIDTRALQLAVEVSLLSGSANFVVGYNSVGAYSSVNHLHAQGYYLNGAEFPERDPLCIHRARRADLIANGLWYMDDREMYFMHTLALQLCDFDNNVQEFAE